MYEIISQKKQTHWQWMAALNFFLGSMGAGLYIMLYFFSGYITWEEGIITAHFLKFISAVLIAAGLLSVATEAGQPMRGLYLFANIRHSWISREVVFAGIFILLSFSQLLINSLTLSFFAVFAALFFVLSQSMILYSSSAVPAWNRPAIPLFFISSAMLNGFGLFLLLSIVNSHFVNSLYPLKIPVLIYGIICIVATQTIWLWTAYVNQDKETRQTILTLRSNPTLIRGVGLSGFLPLIGFAVLIFLNHSPQGFTATLVYAFCSASILFCGYHRFCRLVFGIEFLRTVSVDLKKPGRANT